MSETSNPVTNEEEVKVPYFKTKKGKKTLVGIIVAALSLVVIGLGYYFLISFYLLDIQHLPYIRYRYDIANLDDKKNGTGVEIVLIQGDDIPENFYIPNKIEGMPVTKIKANAFRDLDMIKSVRLPATITEIGNDAFNGCTSLEKVTYAGELQSFGVDVFEQTPYLDNFEGDDGFVYFANALIAYKNVIPKNTAIVASQESEDKLDFDNYINLGDFNDNILLADGVFASQDGIEYVELPKGSTNISNNLFYNCKNLKTVDFSFIAADSETSYYLGTSTFEGCSKLDTSIDGVFKLPKNVVSVGTRCFRGTGITGEVRLGNITYGRRMFENCTKIESISIYNSVREIPDSSFRGCSSLSSIRGLDSNDNEVSYDFISYIGERAFQGTAFTSFNFPKSATSIMPSVFADCTKLQTISFYDEGPVSFFSFAFRNNPALEKFILLDAQGNVIPTTHDITFPSTTTTISFSSGAVPLSGLFGAYTNVDGNTTNIKVDLAAAPQFKSVLIPAAVPSIGTHMFYGNVNLETVDFALASFPLEEEPGPKSKIHTIGTYAFYGCESLTSVVVPESVSSVQISAFEQCTSLDEITLPVNIQTINANILSSTAITSFTVGSNVSLVRAKAVSNNETLLSVIVKASSETSTRLANIEENAFANNNESMKIYFEINRATLDTLSSRWKTGWNHCKGSGETSVEYEYFALGEWEYDIDGNPVVITNP